MVLHIILYKMGIDAKNAEITVFKSEEDGGEYSVWKIVSGSDIFVLKEAKAYEYDIYKRIHSFADCSVPKLLCSVEHGGKNYLLLEFVEGTPLFVCNRDKLTLALDALISIQKAFWEKHEFDDISYFMEKCVPRRRDRGNYLCDSELEKYYEIYLQLFSSDRIPKTFCHDDLLPFNILVSDKKATIIDWEVAGMLPYPTSLARFLAHTEAREDAFFYMSESDCEFAIRYYYNNLIKEKGIPYREYRDVLDYFIFYEYCEWIMLGNKYEDADRERFDRYSKLAKELIPKLNADIITLF